MKSLSIAAVFALCGVAGAQESLESRRDAKLASEFLKKAPWMTDYDKGAAYDWLVAQLGFGQLKLDEAKKKVTALGKLTPERQAVLDPLIANLEVEEIEKEQARALGKKFLELKKAGKIPADDRARMRFWSGLLAYAEDQKDAALYEEAMKGHLEAFLKAEPRMEQLLDALRDDYERTLAKLKAGGK